MKGVDGQLLPRPIPYGFLSVSLVRSSKPLPAAEARVSLRGSWGRSTGRSKAAGPTVWYMSACEMSACSVFVSQFLASPVGETQDVAGSE